MAWKNEPLRNLRMRNSTSPACVDNTRGRAPLRSATRASLRA
jgi:hypothetical protein